MWNCHGNLDSRTVPNIAAIVLEVSSGLDTGSVDLVRGDLERGQALVIVKAN